MLKQTRILQKLSLACLRAITKRSQDYKNNFMLNSAEHEIFLLTNVKVPIIVGILTFMSRKAYKSLENAEFLDIFILMSI